MNGLLKSRKFWLAIADAFFATLAITLSLFLAPDKVADIMKIVVIWQVPLGILIVAITVEDTAKLRAGVHPLQIGKK